MRLAFLDLETTPNIAHVWGLFNQNVSLSQLRESTRVMCFGYKWQGSKPVHFYSEHHHTPEVMIQAAHAALDEADVVCHFNGDRFDVPHLNREFLMAGLNPPAPFQTVDLLKVVRKHFRFTSNKLDHVTRQLGLKGKVSHTGHDLWIRCMAGDAKAWNLMRRYQTQDVLLNEELYNRLLPWIGGHPHVGLIDDKQGETCRCGSSAIQWRGWQFAQTGTYARFQCQECGGWGRSTKRERSVTTT